MNKPEERPSHLDALGLTVLAFIWLFAIVALLLGIFGFLNHIPGAEVAVFAAILLFAAAIVASKL